MNSFSVKSQLWVLKLSTKINDYILRFFLGRNVRENIAKHLMKMDPHFLSLFYFHATGTVDKQNKEAESI